MIKNNRLVSRQQSKAMELDDRVRLEQQITDDMTDKCVLPTIPDDWTLNDYSSASPWREHLFEFLGSVEDRCVLDLGCGYHPTPIYFALAGARRVYACDVSSRALKHIAQVAELYGVGDRVETIQAPAELLPLASETVDLIHGEAVLHHLDLELAGEELFRVMKPGGRAGFKDPLGQNPLLEFSRDYLPYRWKHPSKGTDRPLSFADIHRFGCRFGQCSYRGFGVASLVALAVIRNRESALYRSSHWIDRHLVHPLPMLHRFGRFVVTCVSKSPDGGQTDGGQTAPDLAEGRLARQEDIT